MGPLLLNVIALAISILISRSSVIGFRRLSRVEFENLNKICGKSFMNNHPHGSVQRVAHGSVARQGEFPWAVHMRIVYGWQNTPLGPQALSSGCSGSIISKYHIVTAAHCVIIPDNTYRGWLPFSIENVYIIGGSPCANTTLYFQGQPIPVSSSEQGCTEQVHKNPRAVHVKSIIVPRSSRRAQMELPRFGEILPDIAILELEDPISDMDEEWLPICVPGINTIAPLTFTAYGFGRTENGENVELRKLRVQNYRWFVPNKCGSTWNYEKRCRDSFTFLLPNEDGSMCRGDSGGALSGSIDGKEYLFGVMNLATRKYCKGISPWIWLFERNTFTVTTVAAYSDFLCFYTGVCPLGYDVYSEWNYALNPEAVLFFNKEGSYMLPMREVKAEQESPDESYRGTNGLNATTKLGK